MKIRDVLGEILRKPSGLIPAVWILLLSTLAILGEWASPYDPNEADFLDLYSSPSLEHPFGTDDLGRDQLSRVIAATRVALLAGLQAVGIGVGLGVPIGLFVGYLGGWWDRLIMRIVDAFFSLPGLMLAFAIVALLGPGITNAMYSVGFLFSLRFIRLTRGSVLSVREEPFIAAARLSGAPTSRVLRSYLLPNITGPLIVQISISFAAVLLIEAGLSFLGLGVQPPNATWGAMLRDARVNQSQGPWLPWAPGLAITLTVVAFNTLGDRLQDVLAAGPAGLTQPKPKIDDVGAKLGPLTPASGHPVESSTTAGADVLLEVRNLNVAVPTASGPQLAVRDLSFDVAAGEVVALVGESGSGKTISAMAIAGLLPKRVEAVGSSSVRFAGQQLMGRTDDEMRPVRGAQIGMIFQDPTSSLNPSMTIGSQLMEPLRLHLGMTKSEARVRAVELLDRVGVPDPELRLSAYPHQFSGGMAQRVMISIALAAEPSLLIADEPTTALDTTTQRQVLELLISTCEEFDMAMLFITHDLGVVAEIADRAVVMYSGEAVESQGAFDLFEAPRHPYTSALLGSVPLMGDKREKLVTIPGRVPSPDEHIVGCRFAARCPSVIEQCRDVPPALTTFGAESQSVRCIRPVGATLGELEGTNRPGNAEVAT